MSTVIDVLRLKGSDVYSIEPGASILEAARQMNLRKIGALVVVDDDAAPIGIITERDILVRIVAAERSAAETSVGDIMTTRLITCEPTTPLDELRTIMRRERIRHIPVVNTGRLVGIVSIGDLNTVEVKVLSETIKYFEQYIYGT